VDVGSLLMLIYECACIIVLFDIDNTQHGAGVVLVTADLCRLYHVNYHQLNMYSKLGSRQKLSSVPHLMIYSEVVG